MTFLREMLINKILMSAIIGWGVAQILKTIIHLWFTREFVAERLFGSGGMPSSHSATVCALATTIGMEYGGGSFQFAIAMIFAIIVMYDAIGVRREAGNQAKVLNEMMEVFMSMGSHMKAQDKLKEFVGHTPLQVLAGAILGVLVAIAVSAS